MIVKPIFVIRVPERNARLGEINAHLKQHYPDLYDEYHVLLVSGDITSDVIFECYNPNSIPKKEQKRTKGLILDIISKLK